MATAIIKGSDEPIFQFWEQDFSQWNMGTTNQEFKGTNLAKMSALAQAYYAAGYRGKLHYQNNVATLHITQCGLDVHGGTASPYASGAITDKWQVTVDEEKPDLFENENFINMFAAADAAYFSVGAVISTQVAHCIRAGANVENAGWKTLYDSLNTTGIVKLDGSFVMAGSVKQTLANVIATYSLFQAVKYFADDYFRGATSYVRGKYAVEHTTYAPNKYANNVSDFNVCKIYTIAQLLSEAASTGLWILPLPSFLAYKISNYPVPVAVPSNFQFGALKMRASATLVARGKIEIVTRYLIDIWPKHTYGLAS